MLIGTTMLFITIVDYHFFHRSQGYFISVGYLVSKLK